MGKILTKNDKEIIDFFNRIQDLKEILKSLKTDQLRSLQNEQYITDSELAEKLKLSKRTLSEYRCNGILPYYQIGKKILYKESDIEELLAKNRTNIFGTHFFFFFLKSQEGIACKPFLLVPLFSLSKAPFNIFHIIQYGLIQNFRIMSCHIKIGVSKDFRNILHRNSICQKDYCSSCMSCDMCC